MTAPPTAAALLQQGLFHHRRGELSLAMDRYTDVLRTNPENADALYYVAVVACQEGQYKEGAELARRAIAIGPPAARVHNLLGQAHDRLAQPLEAIKNYDKAIAIDPDFADAHGNRANILAEAGFPDEALKAFDRALSLKPNSVPDWLNRGALLQDIGRGAEALASYDKVVACDPLFAKAHANRASVLKEMGQFDETRGLRNSPRYDEALAALDKAIEIDPQFAEAYLGRGLLKMLRGDWQAGFVDYEHRSNVGEPTYLPLPDERWDGAQRPGERVVLVTEQGLGDMIQFGRLGPLLAARGFDLTILCPKTMAPLLSTLAGVTIEIDADRLAQDKRPLRWLPLLSVPGVLGMEPASVPADVPYLSGTPDRIATWAKRLPSRVFKIGINWGAGHANNNSFVQRDIPLAAFAPLAALPGVQLISLQKGPAVGQIAEVAFGDRIMTLNADPDVAADFFLDTAAVMSQLDLVVTCDTSVAHLAGALARPVFTALPVIGDWRWLLGRDDTPWYPTMRLFRQDASLQWLPVFERMAAVIRERVASVHPNT
jgi:tetratricopeptide (TPR) repeat protein